MREKVKIPKEVAEAIERFRELGWKTPEIANVYEYIHPHGQLKFGACSKLPANHDRYIIGKFIENDVDKQETFIRAVVNGYEVEPPKITLELTPEELGTLLSESAVADPVRANRYAKSNGLRVIGGSCGSSASFNFFERLKRKYYEATGA